MSRWGPPRVTPKKPRTPSSDTKTGLNSTITPGILNSTRSSAHSKHNLTLSSCSRNLLQDAPIIQRETFEFECEFAYNHYLQSLMKRDILQRTIEAHKIKCNDQLEIQREQLETFTDKYIDLQKILKEKDIFLSFVEISEKLVKYLEESRGILTDDFKRTLERFINDLEIESKKMRLLNVETFKSQEDYDAFEKFVKSAKMVTSKYKSTMGDADGIEKLLECLKVNSEILKDVCKKNKILEDLQNCSVNDTLEKASDLLANNCLNI